MRARVELLRNRTGLELFLAAIGALAVIWILVMQPEGLLEPKEWFCLVMGASAWVPLLARTRSCRLAEVRVDDRGVVVRTWRGTKRIPYDRIRGLRAAKGRRGASVLVSLRDGSLLALAVDGLGEARRFVEETKRRADVGDDVHVPARGLSIAGTLLRLVTSAGALGYYLHEVRDLIPGDKAIFGLTGLFAGIALVAWHVLSQRAPLVFTEGSLRTSLGNAKGLPRWTPWPATARVEPFDP